MENMENTSARQEIINKMNRIIQHDAPLYFGFFNESYSLYHNWYKNVKPNLMGRNNLKYKRIDSKLRSQKRMSWNRPIFWPIIAALVIMVICAVPAAVSIWRKQKSLPLKRDL
jgi:anti-sigma-K factor RskA